MQESFACRFCVIRSDRVCSCWKCIVWKRLSSALVTFDIFKASRFFSHWSFNSETFSATSCRCRNSISCSFSSRSRMVFFNPCFSALHSRRRASCFFVAPSMRTLVSSDFIFDLVSACNKCCVYCCLWVSTKSHCLFIYSRKEFTNIARRFNWWLVSCFSVRPSSSFFSSWRSLSWFTPSAHSPFSAFPGVRWFDTEPFATVRIWARCSVRGLLIRSSVISYAAV